VQYEFDWAEDEDQYLELGAGAMIGEGGIPGVTSVANSGTGIPKGEGGNIPSAAQRRKKKRLPAGGGSSSNNPKTKGGYQESIGESGLG
jgi:hypothetical protein